MSEGIPGTPRTWSRRAVLSTIAAVVILAIVVAGTVTLGLLYKHRNARVNSLNRTIATLRSRVAEEGRQATAEYSTGYTAGQKAEDAFNKKFNLTYFDGYKAGWKDVFNEFQGDWTNGDWYYVKVASGPNGYKLQSLVDVQPCQRTYESNDQIYVQGAAC